MTDIVDCAGMSFAQATKVAELLSENERLQRINQELCAAHNTYIVQNSRQADEIYRLRAENKRLQDALIEAAEMVT